MMIGLLGGRAGPLTAIAATTNDALLTTCLQRRELGTRSLRGPGSVAVQREGDIDIRPQRARDIVPVLLAPEQRLPRVQMLRLVEVAVGDVRVVLQARDGKQIVAISCLPHINQVHEPLAM